MKGVHHFFFFFKGCGDNEFFETWWGEEKNSQAKFQAAEKLLLGKGGKKKTFSMLTICLCLVYCPECQFVLINHAYTSILITPYVAALS